VRVPICVFPAILFSASAFAEEADAFTATGAVDPVDSEKKTQLANSAHALDLFVDDSGVLSLDSTSDSRIQFESLLKGTPSTEIDCATVVIAREGGREWWCNTKSGLDQEISTLIELSIATSFSDSVKDSTT